MRRRRLLLVAAALLPLAFAACTLGSAVGMMIDVAVNFGIPSFEESDALKEIMDGDRTAGLAQLETVLAKYEASGEEKSANRVRFLLGTQYMQLGRIDDAERYGKILASDPDLRDFGLLLLSSAREARGDTSTAATLMDETEEALGKRLFFTRLFAGNPGYREAYDLSVQGQHEAAARAWDTAGPIPAAAFDAHTVKGMTYMKVGRYLDAERALRDALVGWRKMYDQAPPNQKPPNLVHHLFTLSQALVHLGEDDEADAVLREAAELADTSRLADETVANVHLELARLRLAEGDIAGALPHAEQSTTIRRAHVSAAADSKLDVIGNLQDLGRQAFALHATLLERAARRRGQPPDVDAIVRLVQLAHRSAAAEAALRTALRIGASDPTLRDLLARRQKAVDEWRTADERLLHIMLSAEDAKSLAPVEALRRSQVSLDETVTKLDRQIARLAPRAVDLSGLRVLSIKEIQAALAPDEALLLFLVEGETSLVIAVNRQRAQVARVAMDTEAVTHSVRALRSTLDPTGLARRADIPPFDVEEAYRLYRAFLEPVTDLIREKRHVLVVPDRALASLPLAVLLTAPVARAPGDLAEHGGLPWLARRHAFSTLPSASTLRALRAEAGRSRATRSFLGIGAPFLPAAGIAGLPPLPPLPAAERELRDMAEALNAGEGSLLIGVRATERNILAADPGDARVLVFATHALDSDDVGADGEPALIVTPERGDGLLTASEIAGLRLDADWVVLSACNTAAGRDKSSNDLLSGLARSFLLAGTRSLLVSHWPVVADASAELTPLLVAGGAAGDSRARALALQSAMMRLIDGASDPDFAHPLFWAPFVIVG